MRRCAFLDRLTSKRECGRTTVRTMPRARDRMVNGRLRCMSSVCQSDMTVPRSTRLKWFTVLIMPVTVLSGPLTSTSTEYMSCHRIAIKNNPLHFAEHMIGFTTQLDLTSIDRAPMLTKVPQADGSGFDCKLRTIFGEHLILIAGAAAVAFPIARRAVDALAEMLNRALLGIDRRQIRIHEPLHFVAAVAGVPAHLEQPSFGGIGRDVVGRHVATFAVAPRRFAHAQAHQHDEQMAQRIDAILTVAHAERGEFLGIPGQGVDVGIATRGAAHLDRGGIADPIFPQGRRKRMRHPDSVTGWRNAAVVPAVARYGRIERGIADRRNGRLVERR